jgi:hypothetical protein
MCIIKKKGSRVQLFPKRVNMSAVCFTFYKKIKALMKMARQVFTAVDVMTTTA